MIVYLVSIFLPPLGLWPGVRYFLQKDPKKRKVGLVAIILTIISTIVTIWLTIGFINNITSNLNTQLQQYPGMLQ